MNSPFLINIFIKRSIDYFVTILIIQKTSTNHRKKKKTKLIFHSVF